MLLREWFDDFWQYSSVDWAGAFLDEWCVQVIRSQIKSMKNVARMLRRHRLLPLNWFGLAVRFHRQSLLIPIETRVMALAAWPPCSERWTASVNA